MTGADLASIADAIASGMAAMPDVTLGSHITRPFPARMTWDQADGGSAGW